MHVRREREMESVDAVAHTMALFACMHFSSTSSASRFSSVFTKGRFLHWLHTIKPIIRVVPERDGWGRGYVKEVRKESLAPPKDGIAGD